MKNIVINNDIIKKTITQYEALNNKTVEQLNIGVENKKALRENGEYNGKNIYSMIIKDSNLFNEVEIVKDTLLNTTALTYKLKFKENKEQIISFLEQLYSLSGKQFNGIEDDSEDLFEFEKQFIWAYKVNNNKFYFGI